MISFLSLGLHYNKSGHWKYPPEIKKYLGEDVIIAHDRTWRDKKNSLLNVWIVLKEENIKPIFKKAAIWYKSNGILKNYSHVAEWVKK